MNSLPVYEFYVALGIVSGFTLLYFLNKKIQKPYFTSARSYFYFVLGAFVSGIWGARVLGEIVASHSKNTLSWSSFDLLFLDRLSGPVVFYGGFLALLYYLFLTARFRKISFLNLLDLTTPALTLGHAIGRLGCWSRGCCHGDICPYFWGISRSPGTPPLHPVQLYESFFLLALTYLTTHNLLLREDLSSPSKPRHWPRNSILLLVAYPAFRFANEFFRGDLDRGFWGALSTSQWISLALLSVGILLWVRESRIKRSATAPTK
jgi:phosphatidylglycerol:prolipoprotein diacylglycerol transferase